jgi:hypothetical protein
VSSKPASKDAFWTTSQNGACSRGSSGFGATQRVEPETGTSIFRSSFLGDAIPADREKARWQAGLLDPIVVVDGQQQVSIRSRRLQKLSQCRDLRRNASSHRRSNVQRFVNSAEVVVGVPERNSSPVVFPFFREGIRQSRKSADAHPDAEIAALHNRSADAFGIGTAHNWDYFHCGHFSRAVAGFPVLRSAVDLDELCEVAAVGKRGGGGRAVRRESIRHDLKLTVGRRVPQAFHEARCRLVALPHRDIQDQLAVALNRERVGIAEIRIIRGTNALLLLADETPDFIEFHISHLDIADSLRHGALTLLASDYENLKNRSVVNAGDAFNRADRAALDQQFQNFFGPGDFGVHAAERLRLRFSECPLALAALVPRMALAVLSEFAAFGIAVFARHPDLAFFGRESQNVRGTQKSLTSGFGPRLSPADGSSHQ